MSAYPDADYVAGQLAKLSLTDARAQLGKLIDEAFTINHGYGEFAHALDFNARLVSRLRERGVRLWGDGAGPPLDT